MFSFFSIPEIGPVTITTDPKKFQFELRELYVQVSDLFILYSSSNTPYFLPMIILLLLVLLL